LDSIAYAARDGPNVVRKRAREPLALPSLPGEISAEAQQSGSRALTGEEKRRMEMNRGEALREIQERQGMDDRAGPSSGEPQSSTVDAPTDLDPEFDDWAGFDEP